MTAKSNYHAQPIPVDDIFVIGNRRAVNDEAVNALVASISEIGLQTPITVRIQADVPDPETGEVLTSAYAIVAGRHRLEAFRKLEWRHIPAIVRDCDEREAELWEIDENLCRAELSPAERAACTARRKALYEEQHPEAKAQVRQGHIRQGAADEKFAAAFTTDTAAKTGQSERAVQLAAERGSKIAPDVMAEVTGSQWDKGVVLDILKKLSHDEQRQALQRVKSGVSPSFSDAFEFIKGEDEPEKAKPKKTRQAPMSDHEACDQWLASGQSWWDRGSKEWQEKFRDWIDRRSVFDSTRAA